MTAVAEIVQRLQLTQHLRDGLRARNPAVEFDNVAELASERTAARELHADVKIVLDLQEIEAGHRALRHIDREFFGFEDAFARARFPRRDELVDNAFGFAEHLEICVAVKFGNGGHARAADHHRLAARPAQIDDFDGIEILRQHAAGHDQVGPVQLALG